MVWGIIPVLYDMSVESVPIVSFSSSLEASLLRAGVVENSAMN